MRRKAGDDRGWISVAKLREILIEVPGDLMLTPDGTAKLHLATKDEFEKAGTIKLIDETAELTEAAKA